MSWFILTTTTQKGKEELCQLLQYIIYIEACDCDLCKDSEEVIVTVHSCPLASNLQESSSVIYE